MYLFLKFTWLLGISFFTTDLIFFPESDIPYFADPIHVVSNKIMIKSIVHHRPSELYRCHPLNGWHLHKN